MDEALLAEIEARAAAATPGPWTTSDGEDSWDLYGGAPVLYDAPWGPAFGHPLKLIKAPKHGTPYAEYWPSDADAAFIAHARTDVPALIEALREVTAERDRLRDAVHVLGDGRCTHGCEHTDEEIQDTRRLR